MQAQQEREGPGQPPDDAVSGAPDSGRRRDNESQPGPSRTPLSALGKDSGASPSNERAHSFYSAVQTVIQGKKLTQKPWFSQDCVKKRRPLLIESAVRSSRLSFADTAGRSGQILPLRASQHESNNKPQQTDNDSVNNHTAPACQEQPDNLGQACKLGHGGEKLVLEQTFASIQGGEEERPKLETSQADHDSVYVTGELSQSDGSIDAPDWTCASAALPEYLDSESDVSCLLDSVSEQLGRKPETEQHRSYQPSPPKQATQKEDITTRPETLVKQDRQKSDACKRRFVGAEADHVSEVVRHEQIEAKTLDVFYHRGGELFSPRARNVLRLPGGKEADHVTDDPGSLGGQVDQVYPQQERTQSSPEQRSPVERLVPVGGRLPRSSLTSGQGHDVSDSQDDPVSVSESDNFILAPSEPAGGTTSPPPQTGSAASFFGNLSPPALLSPALSAILPFGVLDDHTDPGARPLSRTDSSVDPRAESEEEDGDEVITEGERTQPGSTGSLDLSTRGREQTLNPQSTSAGSSVVNSPPSLASLATSAVTVVSTILATAPGLDSHLAPTRRVGTFNTSGGVSNNISGPHYYGPTLAGFASSILTQIVQAHSAEDAAGQPDQHQQPAQTGGLSHATNRRRRLRTQPPIPPLSARQPLAQPIPQPLVPPAAPGLAGLPRPPGGHLAFNFPAPETRPNPPPATIFTRVGPIPAPLLVQVRATRIAQARGQQGPQQLQQQHQGPHHHQQQQQDQEEDQHTQQQQQAHQHQQLNYHRPPSQVDPRQQQQQQQPPPPPPPPPPLPPPGVLHRHQLRQVPAHEIGGQQRLSLRHLHPPPSTPGAQRRHSALVRRQSSLQR